MKPRHGFSFLKWLSYSVLLWKEHCKVVLALNGFPFTLPPPPCITPVPTSEVYGLQLQPAKHYSVILELQLNDYQHSTGNYCCILKYLQKWSSSQEKSIKDNDSHFSSSHAAHPFLENHLPLPHQELWRTQHHEVNSIFSSLFKWMPSTPTIFFNSKCIFLFIACFQNTCSEDPGFFFSFFLLLPIWAVASCFSTWSANETDANVAAIYLHPCCCMSIISKSSGWQKALGNIEAFARWLLLAQHAFLVS